MILVNLLHLATNIKFPDLKKHLNKIYPLDMLEYILPKLSNLANHEIGDTFTSVKFGQFKIIFGSILV